MARRYSASDMQKMVRDKMADYRAKGIDVSGISPTHPGGMSEVLKHFDKNLSDVRDQSQAQTARNAEQHDKKVKESHARVKEQASRLKFEQ